MTKRKKPIIENIPEEYGKKIDLIVKILTSHLNKSNKEILFKTLLELQKNQEISIDFIRYLLLGVYRKSEINKVNQKRIKEVYRQIDYFTRLLKKEGVKIELRPVSYETWQEDIDLIKIKKQRFLKFFKI